MGADNQGYIKIYRKMFSNPTVMKDAEHLAVWVWLLGKAEWKKRDVIFKGKRITLEPGQGLFTLSEMASELCVTKVKCHRIISAFKTELQVKCEGSNKNTLFSIVRWDEYQQSETQNETPVKRHCNATETPVKNLPIIEEYKNIRNEECKGTSDTIPPPFEDVQNFVFENALTVDIQAFMDYYNANGWHVGRNKMKDWRACVRSWDRREKKKKAKEKIDIWSS